LRYDYFNSDKDYQNLDPRLSIKYRLTETSNLKFATGLFHQYVNRMPRLFFASIWTTADQFTAGSSAQHYILSYQKEIGQIYELEVEAFYKKYNDIHQFNHTMLTEIEADKYENDEPVFTESRGLFNTGDGESYGLEILLRKDYGAITGWLGYSLARTNYTFDELNQGNSYIPRHDRTSTINFVANTDLDQLWTEVFGGTQDEDNSKWLFGMNFIYSTGQPITVPNSAYVARRLPDWTDNQNSISLYPTQLNTVRLPDYIRMDISITWEKKYIGWTLAPYLQIFNLGNRKNVWFIEYENELKDNQVEQKIDTIGMLPILPSIGVNIKF